MKTLKTLLLSLVVIIIAASLFFFWRFKEDEGNYSYKRTQVEKAHPEFLKYEGQDSFAGKQVIYKVVGDTYYFAYILNGSGIPIISASCFSVDANNVVKSMGELNSNGQVYSSVNPQNCSGTK